MAYLGGSQTDAFGDGLNHVVNPGHENLNSVTLGGSLQADSDRWNSDVQSVATTPHSVLAPYSFSRSASANGSDGQNFTPGYGYLGNSNGQSADNFDKNMSLRMAGDSSAEL